jgi:hypothetical protein
LNAAELDIATPFCFPFCIPLEKAMTMKLHHQLLIAAALLTFPACEQKPANVNPKDGVKDALDTRPNEGVRDAAEDVQDAAKDVGKDLKDAAKDN